MGVIHSKRWTLGNIYFSNGRSNGMKYKLKVEMSNIWQKVNHIFVHDTICTKHLTMKTDWLILLNAGLNFLLRLNWLIQNIWQIKLILPTRLCAQLLFNLMFSKWACKSHKSLDSFVIKLWSCAEFASCSSRWILSSYHHYTRWKEK